MKVFILKITPGCHGKDDVARLVIACCVCFPCVWLTDVLFDRILVVPCLVSVRVRCRVYNCQIFWLTAVSLTAFGCRVFEYIYIRRYIL